MKQDLSSYMVRGPFVCDPTTTLGEALEMMRQLNFRHLPVVDDEKLVGIVSEHDLREALMASGANLWDVARVMKREVYAVKRDTPLRMVARAMADRKFGSAVVTSSTNEVIGIFTTTDALKILARILEEEDDENYYISDEFFESWAPRAAI